MMRRPVDQAKLLFLYFLRSSAALATESTKHASGNILKSTQQQQQQSLVDAMGGYISIRVAEREDVPSIQRCNLATLPENYNANFYANQMRRWPELALVAEHIPEGCDDDDDDDDKQNQSRRGRSFVLGSKPKINPFSGYEPSAKPKNIVGYVLGKVEERSVPIGGEELYKKVANSLPDGNEYNSPEKYASVFEEIRNNPESMKKERLGHVTSIAVLDDYRRKGLAVELMNQLHYEMKHRYFANAVDLHVRVSNESAYRLYSSKMGYNVEDIIPNYYQNPVEDAYLMRRKVEETSKSGAGSRGEVRKSMRNFRFVPKIKLPSTQLYNSDDEESSRFQLPRVVVNLNKEKDFEVDENDLEFLVQ